MITIDRTDHKICVCNTMYVYVYFNIYAYYACIHIYTQCACTCVSSLHTICHVHIMRQAFTGSVNETFRGVRNGWTGVVPAERCSKYGQRSIPHGRWRIHGCMTKPTTECDALKQRTEADCDSATSRKYNADK